MRKPTTYLALLSLLLPLLLGSVSLARAQNRIEVGPSNRIYVCVGETKTVTITTKIYDDLEDPPGWVPDGGVSFEIKDSSSNSHTTASDGKSSGYTSRATGQATLEIKGSIVGRGEKVKISLPILGYETEIIVFVRTKAWKEKNKKVVESINKINKDLASIYKSTDGAEIKKIARQLRETIGKAPRGTNLTARVRDAAVAEMQVIERSGKHGLGMEDLEAAIAALDALAMDADALTLEVDLEKTEMTDDQVRNYLNELTPQARKDMYNLANSSRWADHFNEHNRAIILRQLDKDGRLKRQ